jgi:hypothetical protein
MIELPGSGDAVMNLIGLILIAALSGGIVAVSLRLRASSARLWIDSDRLRPEAELQKGQVSGRAVSWLTDPFRLNGKSLYNSAKDHLGN